MCKNIFGALTSYTTKPAKLACLIAVTAFASFKAQAQMPTVVADTATAMPWGVFKTTTDIVPVLFAQKSKADLNVGAIGYLNGRLLESTPNGFLFQGVTGRLAGLMTNQSSGIPGSDNVFLTLRGRAPLVLVDGVPRNISELNPEQVESVTVLKDAISSVMLGQRSMNGVVLITTRKGDTDKGDYFNFNIKSQAGIQQPVRTRKYLNAFDYSTLYNEALANDGNPALYTAADLQAYKDGSDPYVHPDVDWQKQIYKSNAGFSRTNLYADGRNKSVRYMLSLDYLDQGGLLRELDSNKYKTNASYKRYILRSNIGIQLTKTLEGYLNLYGRVNNSNAPAGGNLTAVTSELNTTPNNAYPVYNPNNTLGGNINYSSNLWGRSTYSGYFQNLTREAFFDFGLKQSLDNLLPGLAVSGKMSFSSLTNLTTNRSKSFGVVNYKLNDAGQAVYTTLANPQTQGNSSGLSSSEQTSYVEFLTSYNRKFNKHGIQASVTANSENYKLFINSSLPRTITNYAASIKYDWDGKYVVEGAAAYSGLNYYREDLEYGFFPAVGLGWNVDKENFMSSVKTINKLKIRGSYGLTGGTNQGNFNYQRSYISGQNYNFGPTATAAAGLVEGPIPYDNTWSEALKLNIGFDASFIEERLFVSFDYFKSKQTKLPLRRGNNPALLGSTYPILYIGKSDVKGFESTIGWAGKQRGKFNYAISANVSGYQTKIIFNDEQKVAGYANQIRTGQYTNQNYGYISDGFVTTAGAGPVITGYRSQPGDIKYKDLNGDNEIDYRDIAPIGKAKPILSYGFNAQFSYSKVYFSFLVQGVANTNVVLAGNTVFPFLNVGNGAISQAFPQSQNRWTPQTANTATFPRLSIGGNPNNYAASSFWLQNTSFVRLKNAEVGYSFNNKLLRKVKVRNVRMFLNGQNLLTQSDFKVFDPEMPFADYAIQKVYNVGLSVTF